MNPGWFQLWRAQEVISLNEAYRLSQNLPGHTAIGSNGGGELFVFEALRGPVSRVFRVPAIGMARAAVIEGRA